VATPFKENLNADVIRRLADRVAQADPQWDRAAFEALALDRLGELELKARVAQIARALGETLPANFSRAAEVVLAGCEPGLTTTDSLSLGWEYWPVQTWASQAGRGHPEVALPLIAELTTRWSGEFAVRPFLLDDVHGTLVVMLAWTQHENPHVRRLASEGSRPLLPWGERLPSIRDNPALTRPILDALANDPERYVTRSVANHIGDWAKHHTDYAVAAAGQYLAESADGAFIARHGLRHPLKAGHQGALALLGFPPPQIEACELDLTPSVVGVGESLAWTCRLTSGSEGRWMIDYSIQGPKGKPKVFKWTTRTVSAEETVVLSREHPIKRVTTRRLYAGPHMLRVQVNGVEVASVSFEVELD